MRHLETLKIENFKSIREQTLELRPLNVFIGGNGAGKSNLIEVFRLLREAVEQNLKGYTLKKGGADTLLYFGRKRSLTMSIELTFSSKNKNFANGYTLQMQGTDDDALIVARELAYFHDLGKYARPFSEVISEASREAKVSESDEKIAKQVYKDLSGYRIYHFHDTSDTAKVKVTSDLEDNRFLRPQAENLAAFLYFLQERHPSHFQLIEQTVRQIAPFFDQFSLAPSRLNPDKIRLEWKEKGSDAYFNATALSDGTLRFICLATLLLQPELPPVILLDEPELGLHPAAIHLLADLLTSASERTQVLVATQSVTLVNQLTPESVWAVDREDGQSVFRNLSEQNMEGWLDDYALGELWEKNLLGARP